MAGKQELTEEEAIAGCKEAAAAEMDLRASAVIPQTPGVGGYTQQELDAVRDADEDGYGLEVAQSAAKAAQGTQPLPDDFWDKEPQRVTGCGHAGCAGDHCYYEEEEFEDDDPEAVAAGVLGSQPGVGDDAFDADGLPWGCSDDEDVINAHNASWGLGETEETGSAYGH